MIEPRTNGHEILPEIKRRALEDARIEQELPDEHQRLRDLLMRVAQPAKRQRASRDC
jgi:hypothetical protein